MTPTPKDYMRQIMRVEIDSQNKLLTDAEARVESDYKDKRIGDRAHEVFLVARQSLLASEAAMTAEDYGKALYFLIRSVANYNLLLGDKGVLRKKETLT
jgi:hypothetical protein